MLGGDSLSLSRSPLWLPFSFGKVASLGVWTNVTGWTSLTSVLKVAAIDPDAMASTFATPQPPDELGYRCIGTEAKGLQAFLRH
jgi:hypothetical protein